MIENEGERKSMRSNLLEKRRLQLELASYEAAKRNVAIDMRKAQTDMRRRLQRYKARLKEISRSRDDSRIISIEEFLERHKRKKHISVLSPRPHSSPLLRRMSKLIPPGSTLDSPDDAPNPQLFGSRRMSKVDLRPATALAASSSQRNIEAFQSGKGSICVHPKKQIRYFIEEELHDRSLFYNHLLELRKNFQREITQNLQYRVAEFCGKTNQCCLVITDDEHEEPQTWRPLGNGGIDLKPQVRLFKPRIQLPHPTEGSKIRMNEQASTQSLKIPNVVINKVKDQPPIQISKVNLGVRPATVASTRDGKYQRKDFLMPSEF